MERNEALGKFLEIELEEGETWDDYVSESSYRPNEFEAEGKTFLVLTDSEADEATVEHVKESAWAFNAEFLASETGLPEEVFKALQPQCESSNAAIVALIEQTVEGGIEAFAEEAARYDGRGHFLAGYDGTEEEYEEYYIYRTN